MDCPRKKNFGGAPAKSISAYPHQADSSDEHLSRLPSSSSIVTSIRKRKSSCVMSRIGTAHTFSLFKNYSRVVVAYYLARNRKNPP